MNFIILLASQFKSYTKVATHNSVLDFDHSASNNVYLCSKSHNIDDIDIRILFILKSRCFFHFTKKHINVFLPPITSPLFENLTRDFVAYVSLSHDLVCALLRGLQH